jgi:hypothetical protein
MNKDEFQLCERVLNAYATSLESTTGAIDVLIRRLRETGEELIRLQESTETMVNDAVKVEREACARLVERYRDTPGIGLAYAAALIRARGEE